MSWWKAVATLTVLGGCTGLGLAPPASPGPAEPLLASQRRAFDMTYSEAPFAGGTLAVVATEDGTLGTYDLVPCRGGTAVCGGSAQGPAGRLARTTDYVVVDGLYGRRFWLGYGGDGYIERQGSFVPLAWDARPNGQGPGFDAVLETPFRHH